MVFKTIDRLAKLRYNIVKQKNGVIVMRKYPEVIRRLPTQYEMEQQEIHQFKPKSFMIRISLLVLVSLFLVG